MTRRLFSTLGPLLLALTVLVPPPAAQAVPTPWQWVRVVQLVDIAPRAFYSVEAFCPSGYIAITGGLQVGFNANVVRQADYRWVDGAASGWFSSFENHSGSSLLGAVIAECARTTDVPSFTHRSEEFTAGSDGNWRGTVACDDPEDIALTGGVDWNNVNTRYVYSSGPDGFHAWQAVGRNIVAGARMTVEVYCVDPADLGGVFGIVRNQSGSSPWEVSVSCPTGSRLLGGGTVGGNAHASYPDITTWTAKGQSPAPVEVRGFCVDAGDPVITLVSASPGPDGAVTADHTASFTFGGGDPAGYADWFRCSLDGAAPTTCPSDEPYSNLSSGQHQLIAYNEPPDGRKSTFLTYRWSVDRDPPSVSPPPLSRVTLADPVRLTWSASDAIAGVATYDAAWWRAKADGSTSGWIRPAAWTGLTSPSVRTPTPNPGDTFCFSVRARDAVGNTAAWTRPRCSSRPFDDAALAATTGWARDTATQYWNGTFTRTSLQGETLRRAEVSLRQVGLLATRCPGCGAVRVAVDGETIGVVSLEGTTTRHQLVLLLPAFPTKRGPVLLTSATSGESIRVDGLITIRTTTTTPAP